MVGQWHPSYKFLNVYPQLDVLCDKVDGLNFTAMDAIGTRAKELNNLMGEILLALEKMKEVNYNKNKIDYLFQVLEKSMENDN